LRKKSVKPKAKQRSYAMSYLINVCEQMLKRITENGINKAFRKC
jgi:hypothetical protein